MKLFSARHRWTNLSRGLSSASFRDGAIKLKNSIVSSKGNIAPTVIHSEEKAITWYSCGPTVYDAAHIGHARSYVCTDIIRRILSDVYNKDVNFAMGVTDIDDKIIERAASNGLEGWPETEAMVRCLENEFFDDLDALNVRRPDAVLRVTEHIKEIVIYIEQILASGRSYVTPDGVYFSVPSCGDEYLQFQESPLSAENCSLDATTDIPSQIPIEAESNHRLPPIGHKRDRRDFALWKSVKQGEPSWESPWGPGRPGWHIECSAITHSYFGSKMDIHSGGIDLQFPHHTNEIAQCAAHSCSAPSDWVKFWIHTGHLYIEGRKMSKSLKNFISIKDYLSGDYSSHPAIDFRIFCLQNKYHSSVHFSQARIDEAGNFRRKIENYLKLSEAVIANGKLENNISSKGGTVGSSSKPTAESIALRRALAACQVSVRDALADDFDTPGVVKALSYLVGDAMKYASLVALRAPSDTEKARSPDVSYSGSHQPTEPLSAVSHYLADILGKLGADLDLFQSSQRKQDASAHGINSPSEVAILESLLAFRTKVRSVSLSGMKAVKSDLKQRAKSGKDADPIVTVLKGSLGDVLEACDSARMSVGTQFCVQIEDVSETVCIWRPSVVAVPKAAGEADTANKLQ
jgi:cysteinyl-tRNA synthetase